MAVHVRKVDNARNWLKEAFEGGPSGVFKKYRVCVSYPYSRSLLKNSSQRILLMTGRAGTGKTSTIRVLSRELGFEILEWKASATLTTDRKLSIYC